MKYTCGKKKMWATSKGFESHVSFVCLLSDPCLIWYMHTDVETRDAIVRLSNCVPCAARYFEFVV